MKFELLCKRCAVSPPTVPPYRLRLGPRRHRPGVGVTAERPSPLLVWGEGGGAAIYAGSEAGSGPGGSLLPKPALPVWESEFPLQGRGTGWAGGTPPQSQ